MKIGDKIVIIAEPIDLGIVNVIIDDNVICCLTGSQGVITRIFLPTAPGAQNMVYCNVMLLNSEVEYTLKLTHLIKKR
jgi:hypothetical protein